MLTKLTAFKTLFPKYRLLFLSLFSIASKVPVDAPDGQIAEALLFFVKTSASIVGCPCYQKLDVLLLLIFYSLIFY